MTTIQVHDIQDDFDKSPKLKKLGGDVKTTLNKRYNGVEFKSKFNQYFTQKKSWNDSSNDTELLNSPFQVAILQNFIEDENLTLKLVDELTTIEWNRRQMDLYEFSQTNDIVDIDLPHLASFYEFIKTDILPWMTEITGINLTHISASCSMYNKNDYLLVHDDMLSDRRIAYVYYLSPYTNMKEWTPEMGGELELFNNDERGHPNFPVVRKISVKNNQFVFFGVNKRSFHQVGEVTTFDYPRLAISGWFHGPPTLEYFQPSCISPIQATINIYQWVNPDYMKERPQTKIRDHFEDSSEVSLQIFLIPELARQLEVQLITNHDLKWIQQGPANERNYESLDTRNIKGPIKDLITFFTSETMFEFLAHLTQLDLYGEDAKQPTVSVDIQRWSRQSYKILNDADICKEDTLDALYFFTAADDVGLTTYLDPDSERDEESNVLITITPKSNCLNLVFRNGGIVKFTKYVPKSSLVTDDEYRHLIACTYKE